MRQIALVVLGLVIGACGGSDEPSPGSLQSSDCPVFDGFVSYCSQSPDALSCVIRCEKACPDGLGLVCDEVLGRCFAQEES